jgi:hypothetical protein
MGAPCRGCPSGKGGTTTANDEQQQLDIPQLLTMMRSSWLPLLVVELQQPLASLLACRASTW